MRRDRSWEIDESSGIIQSPHGGGDRNSRAASLKFDAYAAGRNRKVGNPRVWWRNLSGGIEGVEQGEQYRTVNLLGQ